MSGIAVSVARNFIQALDRNDVEGLATFCAPNGTWWVDSGLDRASGVHRHDPGDDRPWPLHGTMSLVEKVAMLRHLPKRFPAGIRQRPWNVFGDDRFAVVEVEGDGLYLGERPYQNRYAFVIEVVDGLVADVREYLDTAHAADVFDGRHLDRRTTGAVPIAATIVPIDEMQRLALAFGAAIGAGDGDAIEALAAPDATWWADSGRRRDIGAHDRPADSAPDRAVIGKVPLSLRLPLIGAFAGSFASWTAVPIAVVSDGPMAALQLASHAPLADGSGVYQNRYCFILIADVDGRLCAVREYCDTLHGFDILRRR